MQLKTYEELDRLVDEDTIKLWRYAIELTGEYQALKAKYEQTDDNSV